MNKLWFVALTTLLMTGPAEALRVRAMTTTDLVREAAVVVRGRVLTSESRWNEAHNRIVTDARVAVLETLSGRAGPELVVVQPGGAVGDTRLHIAGVRYLRPSEEVVLFLRTDGQRHYLVGFAQGSLFLEVDGAGKRWVRRDVAGLELAAVRRDGAPPPIEPARRAYEEVANAVRKAAQELGR